MEVGRLGEGDKVGEAQKVGFELNLVYTVLSLTGRNFRPRVTQSCLIPLVVGSEDATYYTHGLDVVS